MDNESMGVLKKEERNIKTNCIKVNVKSVPKLDKAMYSYINEINKLINNLPTYSGWPNYYTQMIFIK